jgi:enamine deaminase RidA (YjgF/YER057c/UK114 family)
VSVESRLKELGIVLPPAPKPVAAYVPAVRSGPYVFVSGQLPLKDGQLTHAGYVGGDLSPEAAKEAARLAAINCLAAHTLVAPLDSIVRVVKVTGYVQSAPGFHGQPAVVNGASELLLDVFGEAGRHARAAVGVNELPLGAAVEVELWTEVRD